MQKVALIIKQRQINAVESIGNQNNQINPCRLCLQFNSMRFSTSTQTTQRIQLFDSKFPAVFHYQKVTDHSPCLQHFLLLNAESKSSSRTDEIRHYDCHVKVHLTPKFFFGRDETLQHSHKEFDNIISIWYS